MLTSGCMSPPLRDANEPVRSAAKRKTMESVEVLLRRRKGRGWDYKQIEIPTDAKMERIAADLHAKGVPAITTALGWKVVYIPASPMSYSTTNVDPFTGERGKVTQHQTHTIA